MSTFAVIDLGTNTFHLLVIEIDSQGEWSPVYKQREHVRLAENGIGQISEEAFNRGIKTLEVFSEKMKKLGVEKIQAFGTAALRNATNSSVFLQEAKDKSGIEVQVINGVQEAQYIYKGVRQAVKMKESPCLIMDIGGGSVEFIIANAQTIFWAQSYPIGVAVLYKKFHRNEPITDLELKELHYFLAHHLGGLKDQLDQYEIECLIGASGTFDILYNLVHGPRDLEREPLPISKVSIQSLADRFRLLGLEQRLQLEDIPKQRAEYIVVAMELLIYIIDLSQIGDILVSPYAMKEGIIVDKWD